MQKLCVALIIALGGTFILAPGDADARTRHHHVGKHHDAKKKQSHRHHAHRKYANHRKSRAAHSVSLAGVTPVLAAKARQIVASCGSSVISAVSRRGNRSNHPIGRAVDLRGNPGCIYAQLKGWPGGYSTDYAASGHVHISYNPGGQEWGLRFAHGGSRHSRVTRYARLRPARQAMQRVAMAKAVDTYSSRNRQTRVTRQARRGTPRYVVQPVSFGPAMHSVH
jgi:hypothetical protein